MSLASFNTNFLQIKPDISDIFRNTGSTGFNKSLAEQQESVMTEGMKRLLVRTVKKRELQQLVGSARLYTVFIVRVNSLTSI